MEAKAINRFVGTSPRKMRIVVDLIRGRGAEEAISVLHFLPKHAAKTAEKVVRSAISNFQNKDEAGRVDVGTLYIKEIFVDGGPMQKRVLPAPMGRAFRIRKRSHHLTVVVAQREGLALKVKPATTRTTAKEAPSKEAKKVEPASKSTAS